MTNQTPTITRLNEKRETGYMDALYDGGWQVSTYEGYLWRCEGCGLVWEKKWHAESCEQRGHKTSFQQGPYSPKQNCNGEWVGGTYYTRAAVRRDKVGG